MLYFHHYFIVIAVLVLSVLLLESVNASLVGVRL